MTNKTPDLCEPEENITDMQLLALQKAYSKSIREIVEAYLTHREQVIEMGTVTGIRPTAEVVQTTKSVEQL